MLNKKAQSLGVGAVPGFVWAIIQIGIFVGIGVIVLAKFMDTTTDATADAAINSTIAAVDDVPTWLPIVIVMVMAGIIISLFNVFRANQ
jgi:hypothetical protein